ncbi:MAG TPA: MnhB domain-containing protein [Geothermobacteraceae bacterium]|nr:MnhB domain-containing protein [Geothermobacteraceae bacterium]
MSDDENQVRSQPGTSGPIVEMAVRIMTPFIQLFGLYVIAHGHYSPGGGFQGGVILGSAYILLGIAFNQQMAMRYFSERVNSLLASSGALIFAGTATVCALLGGLFLDYSALDRVLHLGPIEWRSMGIFVVEVGVGLTVMSIMTSLFWDLGSGGDLEKGL